MIGISIQLLLSYLIIRWFEKGNLSFLGFAPSRQRLTGFVVFLVVTALCCASGFFMRMYFGNEKWQINPAVNFEMIFEGVWWNIKSVLFEELLFRGILFYILIKKLGTTKAILISSVAFGVYHWFSQEVFGQPTQMLIVFLLTGIMGGVYAFGYTQTKSLYIPCAIHFGWNFTQSFVFSQGSIGQGILILQPDQTQVTVSYLVYYAILLLPIISCWVLALFLISRNRYLIS